MTKLRRPAKALLYALASLTLTWVSGPRTSAQATVATNVGEVLGQLELGDAVDVVEVGRSFVIARPRQMPDGTVNHALWESIQVDIREARDTGDRGQWLHDNTFMSRLFGNGIHSYRQRIRPSLQAVFYFFGKPGTPRALKFDRKAPYYIKLDVDRFPPGSTKYNSGRHFVIELFPHLLLRGCTNQQIIAGQLSRRAARNERAHAAAESRRQAERSGRIN